MRWTDIRAASWRKKLVWAAAASGVLVLGVLGWALFWPENSCAEPACAQRRFAVAIEVDSFRQVAPIQFAVPVGRRQVSLHSMLAAGGIDVAVEHDQSNLPYSAASGALDRADLYQFAAVWRNSAPPRGMDAKVYALLAAALVSDTGEPVFGIMFDDVDREGFAVAPATTAHKFADLEPGSVATLQLRTFVHELLHALNRGHLDAALMDDGRLTLEAPTRCISGQQRGEWFLREAPLMAISPGTIRFFQTAASRDVLPGKQNSSFRQGRASPTECEEARANLASDPARTRRQLAARRLRQLFSIQSAGAAENEETAQPEQDPIDQDETAISIEPPVELRIQTLPAAYPLGYPVAVRLMARNSTDGPLPIKDRLMPGYGMVNIEYRRADVPDWGTLEPLAWFEPASDADAMLPPGEETAQTVPIYFGDEGWTFAEPGEYEIRATLRTGEGMEDALSEVAKLRIEAPHTPDDLAALQPLLDEEGHLDDDVGRLLTFGGRIGSPGDIAPLEAVAEKYGHTALGSALRLTLISQRLRPPIDPITGERPLPDLGDVRDLLRNTCTDSGIAALKYQLLRRHAGAIPDNMSNRAESGAAAWDGISTLRGETIPTYSDRALAAWGPSIHFCFNESDLHGSARAATQRLARQLRSEQPSRVVVVGHGDYQGTCRYNDALALRRAQTVRRLLIDAGIRSGHVQIASLGERRPLDFASTDAARDLNRRVEILVEGVTMPPEQTDLPRIVQQCTNQAGLTTRRSRDSRIASSTPL